MDDFNGVFQSLPLTPGGHTIVLYLEGYRTVRHNMYLSPASSFNLRLAPHLWTGAPAFAAGMHVAAASPAGFILEYSLAANPLLHELVEEEFRVKDGMLEIPERAGLGLTIRRDFVARYAVR